MATNDCRLQIGFPHHPKTKKVIKALGYPGGWHLLRLILWTAENRADGQLDGYGDEDLELAVDWPGVDGALIECLSSVGFLEGPEGSRFWHDWEKNQPWLSGAATRSEDARFAALAKHHGKVKAAVIIAEKKGKKGLPPACPPDAERREPHADSATAHCPISASASASDSNSEPESPARDQVASPEMQSASQALRAAGCPDAGALDPVPQRAVTTGIPTQALVDLAKQHQGKSLKYLVHTYCGRQADAKHLGPKASMAGPGPSPVADSSVRGPESQEVANMMARKHWTHLGKSQEEIDDLLVGPKRIHHQGAIR